MASNQQFSVRVVLAIGLTIGVALGAAGTPDEAVAAGGDGSKVAWGNANATIAAGNIDGVTNLFPSKVSSKAGNPVVYYQTKMSTDITIHDDNATKSSKDFIFSLEVKGAAFTGPTSAFHATVEYQGHTAGYICDKDLAIGTALTDAIVTDNIFNAVCTATTTSITAEIAVAKTKFVGAYFSGTAGFYAQCGMTFNAAMTTQDSDLTDSVYNTRTADFTGTATPYTCGCTVKPGITHTDGELKLDVVLTSIAKVPYTVFQLARDASEKLLLDTEATAADDYLTTWKAGKVTAKFTTVKAVISNSVDAALTTADKAADLNATLVSLPTDGAADDLDVAIDGSDNKLVKFEITFNKDLCLGNKKVYVNCFLYSAAATNAAVDGTVAANYVGKGTPQDFDCETGSDDSGAENSIGFSMFLLMLTALAIEL